MWLVIGYGNPLRGDDGAGPLLAAGLAEHLPAHTANIITTHQLTPELALEVAAPEVRQVLFIDAIRDQAAVTIAPIIPAANQSCGHQMSPQLLLQLAEKLYARAVPGWLLTIPGEQFSYSEQLSAFAKKHLHSAQRQAIELLTTTPAALQ